MGITHAPCRRGEERSPDTCPQDPADLETEGGDEPRATGTAPQGKPHARGVERERVPPACEGGEQVLGSPTVWSSRVKRVERLAPTHIFGHLRRQPTSSGCSRQGVYETNSPKSLRR